MTQAARDQGRIPTNPGAGPNAGRDLSTLAGAFPDYDLASLPPLPAHLLDVSWRHDVCPSFRSEEDAGRFGAYVFTDYALPSDREFPDTPRYCVKSLDAETVHAESDDWRDIQITLIGLEFMRRLLSDLGPRTFVTIRQRNATPAYQSGACASHDFCDANMVMLEAWEAVMGREYFRPDFDGTTDESDTMGAAWDWARAHGLEGRA